MARENGAPGVEHRGAEGAEISAFGHTDIRGQSRDIDMVRLQAAHGDRAVRLVSLLPLVPECAAAVFTGLARAEKRPNSASYAFLSRLMTAAAEGVRAGPDVAGIPRSEAASSRGVVQALWRNHHLIRNMEKASPELRQIVRGVLDVLSADGIRERLGEPGFLEEVSHRTVRQFGAAAALFKVGAAATPPPSLRLVVRALSADIGDHFSEFSAETLGRRYPLISIARRAAHHAWCARELTFLLEGPRTAADTV